MGTYRHQKGESKMDKINLVKIVGIASLIPMLYLLEGCTTTPVPEIKIVTEGDVTVTVINGNDKATLGDGANINDADSGLANPTLGLN